MRLYLTIIMIAFSLEAGAIVKTGIFEEDRATADQWTNLIHAINQRCEVTNHGTNPVPPFGYNYLVFPGNAVSTGPIDAGIGKAGVICQTNAATSNVWCYTNYVAATITIPFTNLVGRLTESIYTNWLHTVASNWTFEAPMTLDVAYTNLRLTAQNLYEIDSRLRALVPYFVDMHQIREAGDFNEWFLTTTQTWRWACVEGCEPGGERREAWVSEESFMPNLPFLSVSNAWKYLGLPVHYTETTNRALFTWHEFGYEYGNLDEYSRFRQETRTITNGVWTYAFSLAPSVEVYQVQLASLTLTETNRVVVTNDTGEIQTTKHYEWKRDQFTFLDHLPSSAIFDQERTSTVVYAEISYPYTNGPTISDMSISVSGGLHRVYHPKDLFGNVLDPVEGETLPVATSATLNLPYRHIAHLSSPHQVVQTSFEPPRTNQQPSLAGTRISIISSNSYYRLAGAADINPASHKDAWLERWSIVTQLTHSAVGITIARYFQSNQTLQPVPVAHPSPSLSNGIVQVSIGLTSRNNYNTFGWEVGSVDEMLGVRPFLTFGRTSSSGQSPGDSFSSSDFTNRPFVGHNHSFQLYEGVDYYDTYVTPSRVGAGITFSHVTYFETGHEKQNRLRQNSTTTSLFPLNPSTSHSSSYQNNDEYSSALFAPSMSFPRSLDILVTNLSKEILATADLYARFSYTENVGPMEALAVYNAYESANNGSNCVEVAVTTMVSFARSPLAGLPNDRYYRAASDHLKPIDVDFIEWPSFDFNAGVFPGQDWFESGILNAQQPCEWEQLGSTTNFFQQTRTTTRSSGSDTYDTYYFKTRYWGASRSLDGLFFIFAWDFIDPYQD